jgi:DNA-binding response OmpR family regulator
MDATILVIEEDLDLSKLFYYMLQTEGYDVAVTHAWQSAQEVFTHEEPDLIIFDWALTNTDGYLWIDELRAAPETEHIPVLFVCGDSPSRGVSRQLDQAGIPVIEKPFDVIQFREYVAGMLEPRERMAGAA